MDRLTERIQSLERALLTLAEVLTIEQPTDIERDASIQRFEYTFEAAWKLGKQFLYDIEGIDIGSPKGVIRSFREINIFSNEQAKLGLEMVDDRNLTLHTYNEGVSKKIHSRLPQYHILIGYWLSAIKVKIQ